MGHLKEYYEKLTQFSEAEWLIIAAHFHRQVFLRGETISQIGETERYLSFVETGSVRYYIPGEDSELTFGFCFDREFACAYDSFLTQLPSGYQLQALCDTIVFRISYEDLQKVYDLTFTGERLGRAAAEKLFLAKSRRELSLLTFSAQERYLHLFREEPKVIRQIPLKYIASYIGVTPQALSRIRRRIS